MLLYPAYVIYIAGYIFGEIIEWIQLGIETCGCGEKKNIGEGKYVIAFPRNFLSHYQNYFEVVNRGKRKSTLKTISKEHKGLCCIGQK